MKTRIYATLPLFHNNTKYAFHTQSLIKSKYSNHSKFIYTWATSMSNNAIESQSPWSWILAGHCFANKLTVLLRVSKQKVILANIVYFSNIGSMLGQRRRRWPNIKTALGECLVGVVSSLVIRLLNQPHCTECWRLYLK